MISLVDKIHSGTFPVCAISMKMIDQDKRPNVQPDSQSGPKPAPVAPHPVDGSQYHGVIEEQAWSEQPPSAEEQAPRRVRHLPEPAALPPHPDDPSISIGGG